MSSDKEDVDNEMGNSMDDIPPLPSDKSDNAEGQHMNEQDLENVEEHANDINQALNRLNEMEDNEVVGDTIIVKPQSPLGEEESFAGEADVSMPEEYLVNQSPDGPILGDNEEYEFEPEEEFGRQPTDLTSIGFKNEGDDIDSGDNTDDLDHRSAFERKKETNELRLQEVNKNLNEIDQLRKHVRSLEIEEYQLFAIDSQTEDKTKIELELAKSKCNMTIIKDKINQLSTIYSEK